ncbi:MAG: hypothetical protein JNM81_05380 [Rhodospirillaceae bacterium]|nr:hypothetical protein [Rhodospirillaceae bacterium]
MFLVKTALLKPLSSVPVAALLIALTVNAASASAMAGGVIEQAVQTATVEPQRQDSGPRCVRPCRHRPSTMR